VTSFPDIVRDLVKQALSFLQSLATPFSEGRSGDAADRPRRLEIVRQLTLAP